MTLRSGAAELMRLGTASGGAITHVLLVAKGSTDLHIAWLRAEGGVALGNGCAASEVHRLEKQALQAWEFAKASWLLGWGTLYLKCFFRHVFSISLNWWLVLTLV